MVCSGDFLGSMLAYVGFMLAYVGVMLAYVGIMLAHAGFMLGQVGSCCLKLAPSWRQDAKNGSQEPPRASKMSQDGLKMAPKSIFLRYILLFFHNFHKY